MSAVVPDYTLAFDGGAQLHLLVLLIQNAMPLDLKFTEQENRFDKTEELIDMQLNSVWKWRMNI